SGLRGGHGTGSDADGVSPFGKPAAAARASVYAGAADGRSHWRRGDRAGADHRRARQVAAAQAGPGGGIHRNGPRRGLSLSGKPGVKGCGWEFSFRQSLFRRLQLLSIRFASGFLRGPKRPRRVISWPTVMVFISSGRNANSICHFASLGLSKARRVVLASGGTATFPVISTNLPLYRSLAALVSLAYSCQASSAVSRTSRCWM